MDDLIEIIDASPVLTLWHNDAPDYHKIAVMMMHIDWELGKIREWKAKHQPRQEYVLDVVGEAPESRTWDPSMSQEETEALLFDHIDEMLGKIEAWNKKHPNR